MRKPSPKEQGGLSRREVFGRLGRWLGLGLAGAAVVHLVGRRFFGQASGPSRTPPTVCSQCNIFETCFLPDAEEARRQGLGLLGVLRRPKDAESAPQPEPQCSRGRGELAREPGSNNKRMGV